MKPTSCSAAPAILTVFSFPVCRGVAVEAIVRPWRLPFIVAKLAKSGIKGMTSTEVKGVGMQGGEGTPSFI